MLWSDYLEKRACLHAHCMQATQAAAEAMARVAAPFCWQGNVSLGRKGSKCEAGKKHGYDLVT
jgi:hypothetical protein